MNMHLALLRVMRMRMHHVVMKVVVTSVSTVVVIVMIAVRLRDCMSYVHGGSKGGGKR